MLSRLFLLILNIKQAVFMAPDMVDLLQRQMLLVRVAARSEVLRVVTV